MGSQNNLRTSYDHYLVSMPYSQSKHDITGEPIVLNYNNVRIHNIPLS
jgi:hypothetical protein